MHDLRIRITDDLYETLRMAAKARSMPVRRFAAFRLAIDRYDLVVSELVREGHLSTGKGDKNETVL